MYTLKKSLGQHFLKDEGVCKQIVDSLRQSNFKNLVEVGPGGGAITKYILQIPDINFKAVELDEEKVVYLLKTFPQLTGKIINESILDISEPFQEKFTLIGNFPYNISSQILFKVLEWEPNVETVIGMFQKEVAKRIVAPPDNKEYGILSVLIQAFFKVEYLFDVDEQCFNPPPKIKSGVIRLTNIQNPYNIIQQRKFFNLVKTAFGQRRKQLRNPLKGMFDATVLQDPIFTKRAENLTVADYVDLMKKMK
ncbi:MAG: 16S rRNA (adenine(1518)-N(6)/adenine(1519)-N(6))-dimethyltransferase RsmA [Chitinophagaceae bacterium]|nr:16S rRNA (adenine(1518)-N(6)/adenine(1519)-N(6))-dimethyltransferase RsmA [Chitinophagaceae bacterium]